MTCDGIEFFFKQQTLLLLPQKAIYWKDRKTLIIADVHLGKTAHFRKSGIAIPQELARKDLEVLSALIDGHQPETLIFLGDLFHSDKNSDWGHFALWRKKYAKRSMILIKGNHDIIEEEHFTKLDISVQEEMLVGPFRMAHHPLKMEEAEKLEVYSLCGHIHPGVHLRGKGRDAVTLSCFSFGRNQAILPSFGKFTGRIAVQHQETDRVFGILNDKVVAF
ncbi:ligase-associated DNA damage response endonuclease PdeM [Mucilaginibacter sp. HMF7410]|uniref:Ligase-associated DNA damage response endonuclease PdeM n=2 Tax=Mucilaginibacter arboris TaxID=2682090 RepID=A0A7K1SZV1_9SPHI|nr:ligase-associated DNA damage response endonuclease PdeM [Mucilaginibacter arboris]